METGISKAIRLAGSQTALGALVGLSPQAVQKWAAQGFVPGDMCRKVERVLHGQVTRYELNPDVFGEPHVATAKPRRATDLEPPRGRAGRNLPSAKNIMSISSDQPPLMTKVEREPP